MAKLPELPSFNDEFVADALAQIVRAEVTKTGLTKAVLGVSGGIDSALSLALAIRALGKENVTAVMMPYKSSNPDSLGDAEKLCAKFGVKAETVEITPMADAYFLREPEMSGTRKGNVMARLRMIVLYDLSARDGSLVIGTSNKTEILLGYSTLWGDMASAVNPLGDLYKYQVFALSRHLGVIDEILNKAPSADLWSGQTDEGEMGFSYALADTILYYWLERSYSVAALKELVQTAGADVSVVDQVLRRVERNAYKRQMPVIAKISSVTIGREFRTPPRLGYVMPGDLSRRSFISLLAAMGAVFSGFVWFALRRRPPKTALKGPDLERGHTIRNPFRKQSEAEAFKIGTVIIGAGCQRSFSRVVSAKTGVPELQAV
jgi:NAD+ synthase